jgi:hypothetical protein
MTMPWPPPAARWRLLSDRKLLPEYKTVNDEDLEKRGRGQPPHEPTEKTRATVKAMSAYGIPQEQVARVLDIDSKTLRLHYRDELDLGVIEANAQVAKTLFQQATKEGNTTAAIWWTKSRMGWKEKQELQHTGEGGGPMVMTWLPPSKE